MENYELLIVSDYGDNYYKALDQKGNKLIRVHSVQKLEANNIYEVQGEINDDGKLFIDPKSESKLIRKGLENKVEPGEAKIPKEEFEAEIIDQTPKANSQAVDNSIMNIPEQSRLELTFDNIKKFIQPKATDQEINMFLQLCINQGLNPFIKDAYLIKYGNMPATMVVSKDAFLKKAELLSDYQGFEAGVVILHADKLVEHREGSLVLKDETLIGGWARVFRDNKKEFYSEVSLTEYNTGKSSWNKMPSTMIRKVAIVQALREAFPRSFQGMYDRVEMDIKGEK